MREVSPETLQAMMAESTATVLLPALTFTDPDGVQPTMRVVANNVDIPYGGNTYTALPFKLTLAPDTETSVPQAKISVDNVGLEVTAMIRQVDKKPLIDIELFAVDAAGTVRLELGPTRFTLLSVTATAVTIEGVLGYDFDFLNKSAQAHDFTPGLAPGMFQ